MSLEVKCSSDGPKLAGCLDVIKLVALQVRFELA